MASSNEHIVKIKSDLDDLKTHVQSESSRNLKILENIGDNSFVIKFTQFNEYDLNLTLQIPGKKTIYFCIQLA